MFARDGIELAIHERRIGGNVRQLRSVPSCPGLRRRLFKVCSGPGCEAILYIVRESGHRLTLGDAYFTLGKCRAVRRFHLPSNAGIALLRALLNMLSIEMK